MKLYNFNKFVTEAKNYGHAYSKDQPTLFDINLTDKDYEKFSGKYAKPLEFLKNKYKDVTNDQYGSNETIYSELSEKFPEFSNDEIQEILDEFEKIMQPKWDEDEKYAEKRVENIRDLVIRFGKEHDMNNKFIPSKKNGSFIGRFDDDNLEILYHYLVYGENESVYTIEDVMRATGLEEHEIKIMYVENQ
jgi:hypothetical protein